MDARLARAAVLACALAACGASHRTQNFIVTAPSADLAREVGEQAEIFRRDLAVAWLGKAMPKWSSPCPIEVHAGENVGAGGVTSFVFNGGHVFGWQMSIQGSRERILDSVLPHEITHTIFASHFRQPLPRWADEGACTTVEHPSERAKQQRLLVDFLRSRRGIPFNRMFAMKEYPRDMLPLYSQGHSLTSWMIAQGGRRKFVNYLADGLESQDWQDVTHRYYGSPSLAKLQDNWLAWVRKGSPRFKSPDRPTTLLAGHERPALTEPVVDTEGAPPAAEESFAALEDDQTELETIRSPRRGRLEVEPAAELGVDPSWRPKGAAALASTDKPQTGQSIYAKAREKAARAPQPQEQDQRQQLVRPQPAVPVRQRVLE